MVGNALQRVLPSAFYPSHRDLDLMDTRKTIMWFAAAPVDNVIHLAAKVGGVQANMNQLEAFFSENLTMNMNLLRACHVSGVKKVVSLLSTCVYPDAPYVTYPLTENQLHLGPPHPSNFGYAYAKRMLDVQSRAYRQQYGCNFTTAIPNNLFGPNDNFDLTNGHVIPAVIRKVWEAKQNNSPFVEVWGDGSPLREFTYSLDVARILSCWMLHNYDEPDPVNIGATTEVSIKEVVEMVCGFLEYSGKIQWNTDKPNGQHRKPASNQKLIDLGWKESDYTPFDVALKETCSWFAENYPNVRGV